MSVIGPRPGLWNQDILTAERDKYNANDVKPGLTGWAQINGRDELEIPVKAKLDGEYVKKMGLLMDIKCFLGSVGVFAHDDSVVEGGTGEMAKHSEEQKQTVKKKILDGICGMDEGDELNKAGLIKKCCSLCNVKECETILVGDSNNDIKGAKEAGIAFLGVTYGFGLKREIKYEFDTVLLCAVYT